MDKKKLQMLIAVLVVVCGGMAWYFMYYTKTPTYSLYLIRDAVQKHDVQTFKQHVDLDSVMSRLVDDYLSHKLKNDPEMKDNPFKGLAEGFVNVAKPAMVSVLKDKVIRAVEGDMPDNSQQPTQAAERKDNTAPVDNLNVPAIDYKGIAYEKKDGKIAIVGIKAVDPQLFDEFTFDIKMSELNDGKWQIVEVANVKEYFEKLDHDTKIAIKKYINEIQPIVDEANQKNKNIREKYGGSNKVIDITVPHIEERDRANKDCYDAIEKIEVPAAAQEFASLRKERRKLFEEETTILKKIANGNHSSEVFEEYKNWHKRMDENMKKIKKIEDRVKDVQVP